MKALSIKQPWAWLIVHGYKDIENRTWHIHMPPLLNYPPTPLRIYVHAGKNRAGTGSLYDPIWQFIESRIPLGILHNLQYEINGVEIALGAIIGEVDIVGCVDKSESPWFVGPYGFVLANPVAYKEPIPYRGQLGFFEVNI